jgi:hypothetical protein
MKTRWERHSLRVCKDRTRGLPMPHGFGNWALLTGGSETWTSNPVPPREASAASGNAGTIRTKHGPPAR